MFLGAVGNGLGTAHADIHDGVWILDEEDAEDDYSSAEEGSAIAFLGEGNGQNWEEINFFWFDEEAEEGDGAYRIDIEEEDDSTGNDVLALQIEVGESVLLRVEPQFEEEGDEGIVTFDSDGLGDWDDALCSDGTGDIIECEDVTGEGTDRLIIPEVTGLSTNDVVITNITNDLEVIVVTYTCENEAGEALATITQEEDPEDRIEFWIMCKGPADEIEVSVDPDSVEIVPAVGNTAHALITVELWDEWGGPPLPDAEVQYDVDNCGLETATVSDGDEFDDAEDLLDAMPASYHAWYHFANDGADPDDSELAKGLIEFEDSDDDLPESGISAAIFHADFGGTGHSGEDCDPGVATVTIIVDVIGDKDLVETVEITIVGPPAAVTVEASPTSVVCGEKSTIVATVVDSIGQPVSDHTVVEAVTNAGGVLGGTGAVAAFGGPVVPISSTIAGTFGGDATMFLLTSEAHSGAYEVILTTGGTAPGFFRSLGGSDGFLDGVFDTFDYTTAFSLLGGLFSTAPISAQVTVECTLQAPAPAPTIVAPDTGTGTITPPSTGDAGLLAGSNGSSWSLFAIGGMVAFALAGLATLGFARR